MSRTGLEAPPQEVSEDIIASIGETPLIDVSSLSTDYLSINHSSYAEKTPLLRDIELVLKTGQRPPEQRFPVYIRVPGERGDHWRYPN